MRFLETWSLAAEQEETLRNVDVRIADLPGARLGEASGTTITLDINAAGYGWFVDATPWDDAEFQSIDGTRELTARTDSPAANRFDLLTAVMHELGHVLGYDHQDEGILQNELPLGTRWADTVDTVFAGL